MTRCYQEIATSKVSNLERQNKREIRKLRLDGQGWGEKEKLMNEKEREKCILIKNMEDLKFQSVFSLLEK